MAEIRGFLTPNGQFLSRTGALSWIKRHQPEVYEKVKADGLKPLHSEPYAEWSGLNKKEETKETSMISQPQRSRKIIEEL